MQKTSRAVMAQRNESRDSLDNFPTTLWTTWALIECMIHNKALLAGMSYLEPAYNRGFMSDF